MTDFEQLYSAYFNEVFVYMKRLSRNESVAEEITSEAFFKAMRSLDSFRGDCSIRVWLCQIAKNCYYSSLKKNLRYSGKEFSELAGYQTELDTVKQKLVNKDEAMRIHPLLHALSEPYKEVFMLRVFGELSFRQIGDIFHKTENWACVTYHRARNKIKSKMEDGHDK